MRAYGLSLALFLAGCAAHPTGPARRPVSPPPAAPSATSAADFLDPAVSESELRARHPQRAKVIRAGGRYPSRDSAPEAQPARRMIWPVVVLADPDTDAAPRRLRLLCEHEDYRVAVWVDREDLATVVRAPTHLTTRLPAPEPLGPAAPGVHLPAGYLLDAVQDADGRTQRAAVHGLFFRAELLLHKERVGVTYREAPTLPPPSHFHGEVTRSASFLDAPGGAVVATVTKPAGSANSLYVTRIQDRGDGWTLSRYDDQDAAIIGWVAAGEIRWFDEPVANDSSTGYATGSMGGVHRRLISLSQGTLLRAEATREPIGVVLRTTSFLLTGDSDQAAPVLSLSACGGPVRVRPDGPRP